VLVVAREKPIITMLEDIRCDILKMGSFDVSNTHGT